jgi:hypothetical protein
MIDKRCPWCDTVQAARITRIDAGAAEWQCAGCGGRWTIRDDHPGEAYVFYPRDIDEAFNDAIEPLL